MINPLLILIRTNYMKLSLLLVVAVKVIRVLLFRLFLSAFVITKNALYIFVVCHFDALVILSMKGVT